MPDFGIFRGFNDKLFGNKLYAGQLPTQLGVIGSENVSEFLLDLYPSAAAAYSLRKLREAYTGSAIRVRRSSDNTEQNIGFTLTRDLDTSALTSFCGSGNGFVTTWYDQSGNARNATQTTAANQPQIVSSGGVITEGGKPTIDHLGSQQLRLSSTLDLSTTYSMYGVVKFDAYDRELFGSSFLGSNYGIYQNSTSNYHSAQSRFGSSNGVFGLNFALVSIYRNGTVAITQYKNSSILGNSFNISLNSSFQFRSLSGEEDNAYNLDGKLSEAILYSTNQFSNQSGLEGNIKTYYGL